MTDNQISITALALCIVPAVLHSFEVVFPILARWIVNYVLPWFKPGIPKAKELLTPTEQLGMLDSAIASVPDAKKTAAKDYIFLLLFEQRQNSLVLAVSSPKCKKCSMMLLKVERIRCKQLSGALEAERFARPSV